MKLIALLLLGFIAMAGSVAADDIPPLTAAYSSRFLAAFYTTDGASVVGTTPEFSPLFGDSGTVGGENTVVVQAPFAYNVTNLRVSATQANCGNLGAGESITVRLRVNGANSALSGSCVSGAAVNSFTLDTDTVAVAAGDRLSLSYTPAGILIGTRDIRLGISLEGIKDQNLTTNAVPDMTNEILEAFGVLAPLIFYILVVIWAEVAREYYLYILAIIVGAVLVLGLWEELHGLRTSIILTLVFLCIRAYYAPKNPEDEGV